MAGGRRIIPFLGDPGDPRATLRLNSYLSHILILVVSLAVSHVLINRLGLNLFTTVMAGIFFGTLYTIISFRALAFPFMVWVLAIGGFRYIWSIQTPLLPDLFLDRFLMIWLTVVFMVKVFAQGKGFRKPLTLDILMAAHALYIFVRIYLQGMYFIHPWTMSILVPYGAYFFAKNIIITQKQVRVFLGVLLALTVYYGISAVAQKFLIYWLIWPKSILRGASVFVGRSSGPFESAPLFGTVIGMLIPIHLYFVATVRNLMVKAALWVSLGVGLAGLYFTYTRGSWLAGITALLTVAVLNRRSYGRILLPGMLVIAILAFGFLGASQDEFMKERVENEDTMGARVGTAVTALKVWRDHPVFGVGFFQYRNVLQDYIQPVDVPGLGTIKFVSFRHNNIHDIYLGPLAEDGLVGMAMQFGIYWLILRTFLRKFRWRKDGDHFATYVMPIFGGLFVGYLFGGIAIDYRFFSFVGALFYMCAGILEGYQKTELENVS